MAVDAAKAVSLAVIYEYLVVCIAAMLRSYSHAWNAATVWHPAATTAVSHSQSAVLGVAADGSLATSMWSAAPIPLSSDRLVLLV